MESSLQVGSDISCPADSEHIPEACNFHTASHQRLGWVTLRFAFQRTDQFRDFFFFYFSDVAYMIKRRTRFFDFKKLHLRQNFRGT